MAVDAAVLERLGQRFHRHLGHFDLQARRQRVHPFHQQRQEHHFTDVRHGQREAPRAGGGIEAVPQAERVGEGVHALADRPGQRKGDGRGLHAGGGAQEQRIVELVAQPRQRVADGGLRQMQPLGRAGHAALLHHGQENPHEVQVKVQALPLISV